MYNVYNFTYSNNTFWHNIPPVIYGGLGDFEG